MSKYSIKQKGDKYVIYDGIKVLTTPGGNKVTTLYKPLADRIINDLNTFGYSFNSASSILAWHFTLIDNFEPQSHEYIVDVLSQVFIFRHPDWTCEEEHGSRWLRVFGEWSERSEQIQKWFEAASIMQLTAACCIGNAYGSANIAFELAKTMEQIPAGEERDARFDDFADLVSDTFRFGPKSGIYNDFKTFELYYGFHLDRDGPILNDIAENIGAIVDESDFDVDDLSGYSVSVEQLIGRNYYHYTDFEKDEQQPGEFCFDEIALYEDNDEDEDEEDFEEDEEDDEDEDEEDFEEDEEDDEDEDDEDFEVDEYSLAAHLPDNCWVKRFVDDDDPDVCYLVYIVVDEDGSIKNSGCLYETSTSPGGGMLFMIPGFELPRETTYEYCFFPPEKIYDDLRIMFAGHCMPLDFKFIGKRLPQQMIDEGGNGGSNTNYTYALQSAFRLAYMHMSVNTTEDGVIRSFNYSSYQSSGDAYGDMFSRPTKYYDRRDEAMDMLLYIYDMYTDEELTQK